MSNAKLGWPQHKTCESQMSVEAHLYYKSGEVDDRSAPSTVDPEGRFVFGRNLPKMIDILDDSARQLGITEPSKFVWRDPLDDEGGLDKLSEEEFQERKRKCDAMAKWMPIDQGIHTFKALATRHKLRELNVDEDEPNDREYYIAFEVACLYVALKEAAERGEQGFHIQIY